MATAAAATTTAMPAAPTTAAAAALAEAAMALGPALCSRIAMGAVGSQRLGASHRHEPAARLPRKVGGAAGSGGTAGTRMPWT